MEIKTQPYKHFFKAQKYKLIFSQLRSLLCQRVQHLFLEIRNSIDNFECKNNQIIVTLKTIFMKHSIFFMILVSLFVSEILSATSVIDLKRDPPPPPIPYSMDPDLLVTATIDVADLAIYFETSVGEATITVTDDSGQVIYQESVDTGTTSEIHIPVDLWNTGNYILIISYDSTVLRGNFVVE